MSTFLLALEWGPLSGGLLALSLVALATAIYALVSRQKRFAARPFRRFRLVNKSKAKNIVHAKVTVASATIVLTTNGSIPYVPEGSRSFARPNLMPTSLVLELKAEGSTGAKSITIPGDLGLGWPAADVLESVDVAVTGVNETRVNFGYTLEITLARHLGCQNSDDCDLDAVTMVYTVDPTA